MGQLTPLDFDFKHDPLERERVDHKKGDDIAEEAKGEDKKKILDKSGDDHSDGGYRTVSEIILGPVPYDTVSKMPKAFHAFNKNPDSMGGVTKRVFTLGHDPILGWLFGPINIMTFSSTHKTPFLKTYTVDVNTFQMDKISTFPKEVGRAFHSFQEYNQRLPAAVFKQGMHFLSDKYTKIGLPIPFLSPEKAYELMQKGWNSVEAAEAIKKVLAKTAKNAAIIGAQFIISFLINEIIKAVHLMMYDEEKDGDINLYQVRTRRILRAANCISSSSNILCCAIFGALTNNPVEAAKRLDIGGFIETIRRLVIDTKFIKEIKMEFIKENLLSKITESDFEWLYLEEGENENE